MCEMIVAEEGAKFLIPELPRGLWVANFWHLLSHRAGGGFATDVCMTGRIWTAPRKASSGAPSTAWRRPAAALEGRRGDGGGHHGEPAARVREAVEIRRGAMQEIELKSRLAAASPAAPHRGLPGERVGVRREAAVRSSAAGEGARPDERHIRPSMQRRPPSSRSGDVKVLSTCRATRPGRRRRCCSPTSAPRSSGPRTRRRSATAASPGRRINGHSIYYAVYNRGKKSIGLNRSHPEGRELFRRARSALRRDRGELPPRLLDRLGFSFEAMRRSIRG